MINFVRIAESTISLLQDIRFGTGARNLRILGSSPIPRNHDYEMINGLIHSRIVRNAQCKVSRESRYEPPCYNE